MLSLTMISVNAVKMIIAKSDVSLDSCLNELTFCWFRPK